MLVFKANLIVPWNSTDSPAELDLVRQSAIDAGADAAVVSNHWATGGAGAKALAEALVEVCDRDESKFKVLYDAAASIEAKIEIICKEIYGADGIELSELAQKQLDTYTKQGYGNLPSEFQSRAFGLCYLCPRCANSSAMSS